MAWDDDLLHWLLTCPRLLVPHPSPYLPLMLFADGNLQDHFVALLDAGFSAWMWLQVLSLFWQHHDALWNLLLEKPDLWPGDGSDINSNYYGYQIRALSLALHVFL